MRRQSGAALAYMGRPVRRKRHPSKQLPLLAKVEDKSWKQRAGAVYKIRAIIAGRIFMGESLDQLKEKLSSTEGKVLDVHVMAKERPTIKETAEKLGKAEGTISSCLTSIRYKLMGGYDPSTKRKRWRQSERAKRITELIKRKIKEGETFDQIKARFSEREMQVLDWYVLSNEKLTQWEVGERLGISRSTVSSTLMRVEEKLNWRSVQVQMPFM
jgi:DNA-binding CsgD family transcriptional regulator